MWWRLFNEAISNLTSRGEWYATTGGNLRSFARAKPHPSLSPLGRAISSTGPWMVGGGEVFFFKRGVAFSSWGGGSWREIGEAKVELKLCSILTLTFDSPTNPRRFSYANGEGALSPSSPTYGSAWPEGEEASVKRLLGEGPWRFEERDPIAFLWGGVVASPWGQGKFSPIPESEELRLELSGSVYRIRMTGCYSFKAVRESLLSGPRESKGWVPMKGVSMEYTHWREAWDCKL